MDECKELQMENAALAKQNVQLNESNEELVVAIAVQHLRLLLARWRQPLLRDRFRLQLQVLEALGDFLACAAAAWRCSVRFDRAAKHSAAARHAR